MNTVASLLISSSLLISVAAVSDAREWNGIRPLHSSRSDVERVFGPTVRPCQTLWCMYKLEQENVWIQYASGPPCGTEVSDAWQVPRDTVVEMTVYFRKDRLFEDLKIDLSRYVKTVDQHLPGWIYYTNADDGVMIAGGLRTVTSITYYPESKDKDLRCPKAEPNKALQLTAR